MKESNPQKFTLEDIIREFGTESQAKEEHRDQAETAQDIPDVSLDATLVMEPVAEETLAFDIPEEFFEEKQLAQQEEESDTIRLDGLELPHGTTAQAQPVQEAARTAEEEILSSDWEPEYEESFKEPSPAQPLVLHPQSNPIRELKKQLTAGPERRYYSLLEKGTGKLQSAIFLNLIIVVLCAGATVLQAFGFIGPDHIRMMVFGQILAMFLSALLGSFQLIDGITSVEQKRFTLNSLLVVTFLVCCADAVFCLNQLRVPCCATFCLEMTFSQLSTYHQRNTMLSQLDTMRKTTRLDGTCVQFQEDGTKLFMPTEGRVSDFMDNYLARSASDKLQSIYALVVLGISLALGVTAFILKDISTGVQVFAVSLLAALPAASFVCASRPMAIAEHRLRKLGTVLCGWQGVQGAAGKASVLLRYEDLFPEGCAKMNGVKFFGERTPEEVVSYACALIQATESGLTPLFLQLLESHNGSHYEADDLQAYEHGVGGQVQGVTVLAGSLSFLKEMGVEADSSLRISQSVCVAIDGELSGMFAITYDKNKSSAAGLHTLTSYRKLTTTLVAADPMLTASFLHNKFGVHTKHMAFPDYPTRQDLRCLVAEEGSAALFLTTKPGLAPVAYGITAARAIHTAATLGTIVQMVGGAVGLAMMGVLTVLGAFHLLTPVNMFLYQLLWLVPGLLITEWTRSI